MSDDVFRLSAEEAFEQPDMRYDEFDSIVDSSLQPRSPDVLFDKLRVLLNGVSEARVLDAGCRDATHMCEIAERFDALIWGIDLIGSNVELATKKIADADLSERVSVARGDIQSLKFADDAFDVVWCRDMLTVVPDLRRAFSECARVLKPGGHMLIFTNFVTDLMEPSEFERLCGPLGVCADNLSRDYFEAAFRDSGFQIAEYERIDGEWREEEGDSKTSRQLLRISRMLRNRDKPANQGQSQGLRDRAGGLLLGRVPHDRKDVGRDLHIAKTCEVTGNSGYSWANRPSTSTDKQKWSQCGTVSARRLTT